MYVQTEQDSVVTPALPVVALWSLQDHLPHRLDCHAGETLQLGRSRDCWVQVPDLLASFVHCEIEVADDLTCTVTDLISTNGTLVNHVPIAQPTVLRPDCYLTLGHTHFVALGLDERLRIAARDPTSFLANAADAYGSSRKAAPHVRRNYKTIWKAVKRYLKKPKKQR